MIKIQVILGSTRQARQGDKVSFWFMSEVAKRTDSDVTYEFIDLREYPLPFFDELMSPIALKGNYVGDEAKKWVKKISEADGFVFITPEYNHGIPAVLKNAFDYIYYEWNKKPGAIVSYSGTPSSGILAMEQLRALLVQVQVVPVSNSVKIPNVSKAFDESGQPLDQSQGEHAQGLLDQLLWWARLLKPARESLK